MSREGLSAGTVGNPTPNSVLGNYVSRHTSRRPHDVRGGCGSIPVGLISKNNSLNFV